MVENTGITKAGIWILGNDPGIRNNGVALVELTGVGSIINIEGEVLERLATPCFIIHQMAVLDLEAPREYDEDLVSLNTGKLEALAPHMSSERSMNKGMGKYRRALVHLMSDEKWEEVYQTHPCAMTGCDELPVLAIENQLDVTDIDPKEKQRDAELWRIENDATLAIRNNSVKDAPSWLTRLLTIVAGRKLKYPPRDAFNKARMYTLSNVMAATVHGRDEMDGNTNRLVINAAKKHAIASDNSLTYTERKAAAADLLYVMLRDQQMNPASTPAEKANADKWLPFLEEKAAEGQQVHDMADAVLLCIEVGMGIHLEWYKRFNEEDGTWSCYAAVTQADVDAMQPGLLARRGPLPPLPKAKRQRKRTVSAKPRNKEAAPPKKAKRKNTANDMPEISMDSSLEEEMPQEKKKQKKRPRDTETKQKRAKKPKLEETATTKSKSKKRARDSEQDPGRREKKKPRV